MKLMSVVKFFLKLSIAFLLIYWLLKSGKIDFSLLLTSTQYKGSWILALFIYMINIIIVSVRWKVILATKSVKNFSYLSMIQLTWIGGLFNMVLPGAVSGDFIKLLYVRKIDPELSKTFLLTSVFMDRVLGLFGLLFLMGIASVINYFELIALSPSIKNLVHLNFMIFLMMVLFFLSLFLPENFQRRVFRLGEKIPFIGKFFNKTLDQFWSIGKYKKSMVLLVLVSMLTQSMNILTFWILTSPFFEYAPNVAHTLSLSHAFTFIPLGLVVVAIPITPAGLGVGHVAFSTLFAYYGVTNGASLFNNYLMLGALVNLMGLVPYLMHRKEYTADAADTADSKATIRTGNGTAATFGA
ncbi:MAG: flippase-like domain-containing protein [Oligoflexia bacterium]|nr:flippase-like domain-containing protein [Oligoflexia bacterium]